MPQPSTAGFGDRARSAGRPPKTSREKIVACAIAILADEPGAGVSLNRIARELKIAPMALYNYFENRDELLQSVTEQLMSEFAYVDQGERPWEARLLDWSHAVRQHFRRFPYLLQMLTWDGHASVAWLRNSAVVADILLEAGLEGQLLTRTVVWVWSTVTGVINNELLDRASPRRFGASELLRMQEPLRRRMRAFQAYASSAEFHDEGFEFSLARLMDALRSLVAAQSQVSAGSTVTRAKRPEEGR